MPVYGKPSITSDAVADLRNQGTSVEIWVVDNKGDYVASGRERVVRPGRNLGWLGGTNAGIAAARADAAYTHLLLLNNDVRLSLGLVDGLLATRAAMAAPCYDGFWRHQWTAHAGRADRYRPGRAVWEVPFVDGTCFLIATRALDDVGGLDPEFEPYGWGAEVDLGFRFQDAGETVVVTSAAFVEHAGEATALDVHGPGYGHAARAHMYGVLEERYGADWERRAGIAGSTHNTTYVGRKRRVLDTIRLRARR